MTLEHLTCSVLSRSPYCMAVEYGLSWNMPRSSPTKDQFTIDAITRLEHIFNNREIGDVAVNGRVTYMNESALLVHEHDGGAAYLAMRPRHNTKYNESGLAIIGLGMDYDAANDAAIIACGMFPQKIESAVLAYKFLYADRPSIIRRRNVAGASFPELPHLF